MSWLSDASANKIVQSYINNFMDVSGNFKVRSAGSTTVDTGPVSWTQLGSDIDGEAAGDQSGYTVSLSSDGTIMAVGAIGNSDNGYRAGHVRVYEWNGSSWSQLGSDIDGSAEGDNAGRVSLSSDGTILAIGAIFNDGNGSNSGQVRVYKWNGSSWTQLGSDIYGEAAEDRAGIWVSLSSDGTIVAIGSDLNDSGGSNSGQVRVFEWNGSSWNQIGNDINGQATEDRFGYSVSLSNDGSIVAMGGYKHDTNGTDSGYVRVFQYSYSTWSQLGSDIDGEASGDNSGFSVSLSDDGTIVAIGAYGNDGNGSNSGHVRVYEWNGSSWSQLGSDIDGEAADDRSGSSVSLSSDGTILAIGAYNNDGGGSSSGHVRVYEYANSTWTQIGSDIDGEASTDYSAFFALSLSSDGTIVAIGAYSNNGNGTDSGHTRVYQKTGGLVTTTTSVEALDVSGGTISMLQNTEYVDAVPYSTTQLGQDLVGAIGDGMGGDVAMNEDGTIMVVGAIGIKANNGTSRTGAAYVYEDVNGTWTLKGSEIKPFPTATTDLRFGESVGINNVGNTIVVGASVHGSASSLASISAWEYSEDTSDWVQKGSILYADAVSDNFAMVAINKTGDMIAGSAPGGGYVRVYQYTNNDWLQIGNFSISSFTAYVGRYRGSITFCDDIPGRFAFGDAVGDGSVQVHDYDFDNSTWTQVGSTLTVTMATASANINDGGFGSSVSFNKEGNLLAVGAIDGGLDGTGDGDARVFQYNSGTSVWEQLGDTLHKDDDRGEGAHGCIVKLDHTGTLLAVANYSYEPGGSLRKAGAIIIYKYRNDAWDEVILQQHTDNTGQFWGDGTTLSKDGTRFAGSTLNGDVNGKNDGIVRAFTITGNEATVVTTVPTMKVSPGVVDISGTSWINRGQSGNTISEAYQKGLIIESSSTSANDAVLHVETAGQTQAFSVRANGDVYSDNTLRHSSDDRRKTNEQHITNAMETLNKLSPQIYIKLNDLIENNGMYSKVESGLIAQEIYYNAPELRHLVSIKDENGNDVTPQEYDLSGNDIQNDPDYTALGWGPKSAYVDYIGLIPYLIKANQEKQATLDAQEATITQQTSQVEDLKTRLSSLEAK